MGIGAGTIIATGATVITGRTKTAMATTRRAGKATTLPATTAAAPV